MRLTITTAQEVAQALDEFESLAEEVKEAAEGYTGLEGETGADVREERAGYREAWDDNIDDLEAAAVTLVELFGYEAQPKSRRKAAR
jgi:hypothetical protein